MVHIFSSCGNSASSDVVFPIRCLFSINFGRTPVSETMKRQHDKLTNIRNDFWRRGWNWGMSELYSHLQAKSGTGKGMNVLAMNEQIVLGPRAVSDSGLCL